MTDIKFNIDQKELTDERVNAHKDFKRLMYNYELATKPLHKTPLHKWKHRKVYLVILLVLLILFIIIELVEN